MIDAEVDEVTGTFADVDDAWVGLAVRVVDVAESEPGGESWRLLATSEEVLCVGLPELYPDEVPLLASADGEFWAVAAPSSPGCF